MHIHQTSYSGQIPTRRLLGSREKYTVSRKQYHNPHRTFDRNQYPASLSFPNRFPSLLVDLIQVFNLFDPALSLSLHHPIPTIVPSLCAWCLPRSSIFRPLRFAIKHLNFSNIGSNDPTSPSMTSPREWWRRAAAAIKDRQSIYLTRIITGSSRFRNAELEAAVIRATSHDDRSVDYKNAARVFAWARTSPSFLLPVMWALARRAARTRSWPVALKTLMLIHGILMRSDSEPVDSKVGRLPFDLSEFKDRSSSPAKASAFSAFVRAYFNFLDSRSVFAGLAYDLTDEDQLLDRVKKLQLLLDLLMQIRPYGDGMEVGLVLEAMNCVLIEIFEVYSQICKGVASFLVNVFGSDHNPKSEFCLNECGNLSPEAKMRRGIVGVRVLRKATEQSSQLSAYFELCRSLGVLNAAELPEVEKIPEEDIQDLEMLLLGEAEEEEEERREIESPVEQELEYLMVSPRAQLIETPVEQIHGEEGREGISEEWVIFEDDQNERQWLFGKEKSEEGFVLDNFSVQARNPRRSPPWPSLMNPSRGMPFANNGNLIELI